MNKCAILTMDCLDNFEVYDQLIETPLADSGWQTELISWRQPGVNWHDYQAVIIRSPWDYQDDAQAFISVLSAIENSTAHLENSLATVQWNIDKKYLAELERQGVNIVKTLWRDNLAKEDIAQYFSQLDVSQLVIKPRISANADNTYWLKKDNYHQVLPELIDVFQQGHFLVQPFMQSVIDEGEYSLFYFNGHYSHAILKTPKSDDFRVQEEHGGRLTSIVPEPALLHAAESVMAAIKVSVAMPLYARIDFVRDDKDFALMEAELIEPSLYFNMDIDSPRRFADAFVARMKELGAVEPTAQ